MRQLPLHDRVTRDAHSHTGDGREMDTAPQSRTWQRRCERSTARRVWAEASGGGRAPERSRQRMEVVCLIILMGKGLSMKIFSTIPFFRPTSKPSRPDGPPTTLMYRITDSSIHSRS